MFAASVAAEALLFPVGALMFSRVTFAGLALNFLAIPLMARRADRRDGGRASGDRLSRRGAALAGMDRAPGRGRPRAVGGSGAVCAGAHAIGWRRRPGLSSRPTTAPLPRGGGRPRVGSERGVVVRCAAALWILTDPRTLVARAAMAACTSRFSTSARATPRSWSFPADRRCWSTPAACRPPSSFDIGDRVVAPVVRDAGFRRIDYVALTHGDPDHIGGAESILREFRPREVWEGIPVPRFEPLHAPATGGSGRRREVGQRLSRRSARHRRGRSRRAPSRSRRLGASEGAERRLAGARAALARRVGAADRRHRQGGRTRRRRRRSLPRACASSRFRITAA